MTNYRRELNANLEDNIKKALVKSSQKLNSTSAVNNDILIEATQKRIVNAYLPAIIISTLSEKSTITATGIISTIKKRYNIQMSPGTVYPILYKLERQKNIARLPRRKKKIYMLTEKDVNLVSEKVSEMLEQLDFLMTNSTYVEHVQAYLEKIKNSPTN